MKNQMHVFGFLFLFVALCANNLWAQNHTFGSAANQPVVWKNTIDKPAPYKKGDVVTVTCEATIKNGFYVYSTVPPEKSANLPTEIELTAKAKGVKLEGKPTEKGEITKQYDDIFETELRYYKKKLILTQTFKITEDKPNLEGQVKYQVCDEEGRCVLMYNPFKF